MENLLNNFVNSVSNTIKEKIAPNSDTINLNKKDIQIMNEEDKKMETINDNNLDSDNIKQNDDDNIVVKEDNNDIDNNLDDDNEYEDDDDDGDDDDDDGDDDDDDDDNNDDNNENIKKEEEEVNSFLENLVNDFNISDDNSDYESYSDDLGGVIDNSDDDDDDDDFLDEDLEYRKIDNLLIKKNLSQNHQEVFKKNTNQLKIISKCIRNKANNICDPFHNTIPILTKYEKAKVLGLRCEQLSNGSEPFIKCKDFESNIMIAKKELNNKLLPFIIKRPLPNGKCEYWKLKDLEILDI